MIVHVFCSFNLYLVAWHFYFFVRDDIIPLELQPLILPLIENNIVLEVESAHVVCLVILIHNPTVDLIGVLQDALVLQVVEFN